MQSNEEYKRKRREYVKLKYHNDPEFRKKLIRNVVKSYKKKYQQIVTEIRLLLGNKCIRCGFSDPRALQIDHVHGKGLDERKQINSGSRFYLIILNKIKSGSKDYQLLCANCNCIKRHENNEFPKSQLENEKLLWKRKKNDRF